MHLLLLLLLDDSTGLETALVHLSCINNVLEVFGDISLAVVAELLDDLEAVKEGPVVFQIGLPLHDADRVVCTHIAHSHSVSQFRQGTVIYLLL